MRLLLAVDSIVNEPKSNGLLEELTRELKHEGELLAVGYQRVHLFDGVAFFAPLFDRDRVTITARDNLDGEPVTQLSNVFFAIQVEQYEVGVACDHLELVTILLDRQSPKAAHVIEQRVSEGNAIHLFQEAGLTEDVERKHRPAGKP